MSSNSEENTSEVEANVCTAQLVYRCMPSFNLIIQPNQPQKSEKVEQPLYYYIFMFYAVYNKVRDILVQNWNTYPAFVALMYPCMNT